MRINNENQLSATSDTNASFGLWAGIAFCIAFTGLIWLVRPLMPQIDFAPDTGFAHYYWKLPEPTVMSRVTSWGGYLLHQVTIWGLIYYAQSNKLRYKNKLHNVNIAALAANAFFVLFHLLQTGIWYDGLAQDTHIASSQGSVILMLVLVLLMENRRRGLFFGKKIKWLNEPAKIVGYYHGYIFSWAVIYTFWYHPMESTSGHLIGTFYTLLIMLQGSLFFTRIHVNRWWMFVQEGTVLIHGSLVAWMSSVRDPEVPNMWAMFFWGFAALIVVTQMYGLKLKRWQMWAVNIAFILGVTATYNGNWGDLNEVLRIPVIEYGLVFVIAILIWVGIGVRRLINRPKQQDVGMVSAD